MLLEVVPELAPLSPRPTITLHVEIDGVQYPQCPVDAAFHPPASDNTDGSQ